MIEPGLERTYQELSRGVDPAVAADIGFEVPDQYLPITPEPGPTTSEFKQYKITKEALYALSDETASAPPCTKTSYTVGYLADRGYFPKN